jgi:WD40 repeat protein
LPGHDGTVRTLGWQPNTYRLASGGGRLRESAVKISDLTRNEPTKHVRVKGLIRALAWSPDGRWIATGAQAVAESGDALRVWTAAGEPAPTPVLSDLSFVT